MTRIDKLKACLATDHMPDVFAQLAQDADLLCQGVLQAAKWITA